MARFFADEDFSLPVVEGLRRLGHDVVTVSDIGRANQRWPDHAVFFYAVAQRRTLLTKNRRHFYKLYRDHPAHHGIIACSEDPDFEGVTRRINDAIASRSSLTGEFIRVYQLPNK